jgi:hypothetical protein
MVELIYFSEALAASFNRAMSDSAKQLRRVPYSAELIFNVIMSGVR